MSELDKDFFKRADEHINLSNEQLKSESKGKVSASMMYSTARFNAWTSATGWNNGEEMKKGRAETINYFVKEYKAMLEVHLNDYIENFDNYMNK